MSNHLGARDMLDVLSGDETTLQLKIENIIKELSQKGNSTLWPSMLIPGSHN